MMKSERSHQAKNIIEHEWKDAHLNIVDICKVLEILSYIIWRSSQ